MPLVTGIITEDGAVVDLLVGVSEQRRQRLVSAGFPVPKSVGLRVQVDTGSFITGLIPQVFDQLGIAFFATVLVRTPSTTPDKPAECEQFDVSLALLSGTTPEYLPSIHVIASADFEREENVQGILGRDVLNRCVFTYEGPTRSFFLAF